MTEEVMMIPTREIEQLIQYYKGQIMDNALLNKTGRLAAESHLLLKDKSIPDALAIKKIKPLAHERGPLTKRVRQFCTVSGRRPDEEEEEGEEVEGELVSGPLETMFKELIKSASQGAKKPRIKEEKTLTKPSTSGIKKKSPIPHDSELGTLPSKSDTLVGKGKGKRKTEVENLKP